ncbi:MULTISPECIES: glutamate racemase [Allobacillus]|uniref:Glutamate racemase n=1 Tax=Allobacillus salarius TaxID=1955272 RepID=A0A556PPU8_9BACI|nr:glutamate racemase [Allobacillus salarius]TSJ66416.1 glutamate racemase [Allobacillus salarius]
MNKPIGVIDSGIGGLTVLTELHRQLPDEQFIYLGDTLRCPYGTKTEEQVIQYTWELVNYLTHHDIKLLVIACNTATAILLDDLREKLSIPVIGVIEPGSRAAVQSTKTNSVGVIGTTNTVKSDAYANTLKMLNPAIESMSVACPKFVPMIENGNVTGDAVKQIVNESLQPFQDKTEMDTLILGCTHYPIIQDIIEEIVGDHVMVLSSALETATEVRSILAYTNTLHEPMDAPVEPIIYTTQEIQSFEKLSALLNQFAHIHLAKVQ